MKNKINKFLSGGDVYLVAITIFYIIWRAGVFLKRL
jgi:hypothetical protein